MLYFWSNIFAQRGPVVQDMNTLADIYSGNMIDDQQGFI